MGQQHRKVTKRRRRIEYIKRQKELLKLSKAAAPVQLAKKSGKAAVETPGEEPAKKAPAKKAPAKKEAAVKKAPAAKKETAEKKEAPAKKAPAKKAPAKKDEVKAPEAESAAE